MHALLAARAQKAPMGGYGLPRPPPVLEEECSTDPVPPALGSPRYVADFASSPWEAKARTPTDEDVPPHHEDAVRSQLVAHQGVGLESTRLPPVGSLEWHAMEYLSRMRLLENGLIVDQRDGMLRIDSLTAPGPSPATSALAAHPYMAAFAGRPAAPFQVGRSAPSQLSTTSHQLGFGKPAPIRPVRTSESTLCSLSDQR